MKKLTGILALGALLFACQSKTEAEIGNKTSIEVQSVVDVGDVVRGENVQAEFTVKNVGDYPLIIVEAKGSCTCTVADFSKDPIPPGESQKIRATVKTASASTGPIKKDVRIVANTEPSVTTVLIKANVVKD